MAGRESVHGNGRNLSPCLSPRRSSLSRRSVPAVKYRVLRSPPSTTYPFDFNSERSLTLALSVTTLIRVSGSSPKTALRRSRRIISLRVRLRMYLCCSSVRSSPSREAVRQTVVLLMPRLSAISEKERSWKWACMCPARPVSFRLARLAMPSLRAMFLTAVSLMPSTQAVWGVVSTG